jgi:DNA recombination protein RmuC
MDPGMILNAAAFVFSVLSFALLTTLLVRHKSSAESGMETAAAVSTVIASVKESQTALERLIRDELSRSEGGLRAELGTNLSSIRQDMQNALSALRQELGETLKNSIDSIVLAQGELAKGQKAQLDSFATTIENLTKTNDTRQSQMIQTIENRLNDIRTSNESKLEDMRKTVDEKLQGTLETRLGQSFKIVSDRLEQVHQGLGEMQNLATGVGDLKKVLTNVKSRGTWGEFQLSALLEDILAPEQFQRNVKIRPRSSEIVEFAIRLPGKDDEQEQVWLPIDSKFPKEDYERLLKAQEEGLVDAAEESARALESSIESCARDIQAKYIHPPYSVDFGVLFLPVESLYAEILRKPGLMDRIQQKYRVTIAGPTTLAALLTSLQMGFRSLAIQKRSSEVWKVLGAVKGEFDKFGGILEKATGQLETVQRTILSATTKTKTISQKLKNVEILPQQEAQAQLGVSWEPLSELVGEGEADDHE